MKLGLVSILPGVPNLLLLLLIDSCLIFGSMLCKRAHATNTGSSSGKKKVVIIGEMSDLAFEMATNASASTNYALDDVTFADYDDAPPFQQSDDSETHQHHRHSPSHHSKYTFQDGRGRTRVRPWVGKRTASGLTQSPGSVFVPVAAYSVTHSRVGSGPGGVRRMRPGKTTESAVYGYVQKPEIVEFRGQYFYGPNPSPASHHHGHYSPIPAASHHYSPGLSASASDSVASSSSWAPFSTSSKISNKSGGLGPGGLLLATLPLILAPMLSYLFTPMVIPVTATIAAGKKRKRRMISRAEDDVSLSMEPDSASPPFALHPRLPSPAPDSGSVSNFLPRDSQAATPFGFDSRKTMNLSTARRRGALHVRRYPVHFRAPVSSLKEILDVREDMQQTQDRHAIFRRRLRIPQMTSLQRRQQQPTAPF